MSQFYIGVIEDRHDPLQMGRVRVRVAGLHSPDRINDIPIESLPWSLVMQPASASSTSGKISQLVEGTWVIVMYYDDNLQDPIVIGSLPSTVGEQRPNYNSGFSDPYGVYPKYTNGESDTSLIGKPEEFQEHPTYTERERTSLKEDIPTAKAYHAESVDEEEPGLAGERVVWNEAPLRGNSCSQYPYNDVHEYEGGMVQEFDSSPGAQRITTMHPSGTYEEILVNGSKTTKIVSDSYEITLGNNSIYIKGDLNLTVEGNMRHLVKGDYILEVGGNFYQMINKKRSVKISGNDLLEIGLDQSINIQNNHSLRCGGNQTIIVGEDHLLEVLNDSGTTIANNNSLFVTNNNSKIVGSNDITAVSGNKGLAIGGKYDLETIGNITFDTSENMNEIISGNQTTTANGNITITASRIDLN